MYENEKTFDLIPTREQLNEKLINHYKYREIGFETVGRFADELKITMNEIMPRYNELFKTVVIMSEIKDPFGNVDFTETFEQESESTSKSDGKNTGSSSENSSNNSTDTGTSESSSTSNGKNVKADTPQDKISIGTKDIDSVDYASEANWNEDISNVEGSSSNTSSSSGTHSRSSEDISEGSSESAGKVKHTLRKVGNQGVNTYAHDMNEFRTSIIDVVEQIINDSRLSELFIQVY